MANKVYTYTFICVGIIILMNLAGLQTLSGTVLGKLGITSIESLSDIESTGFYLKITGLIASLIGLGVLISIEVFGKGSNDTAAFATISSSLFVLFIAELSNVAYITAKETEPWVGWLIFGIMVPFIIGYAISIVDWIRGTD